MRTNFITGVLFGLLAGALWGIIYVAPLWLSDYSPVTVALGRFVLFGVSSLPFLWIYRHTFKREIRRSDLLKAFGLAMIGNVLFYPALTICIRYAGAPLAGMLTALIPVGVAILGNLYSKNSGAFVPWKKVIPPLILMVVGLVLANGTELTYKLQTVSLELYIVGVVSGVISVILWTGFALWNSMYLLNHPKVPPVLWTAMQGSTVIPVVYLSAYLWCYEFGGMDTTVSLLGPRPWFFVLVVAILAIVCSWLAMWCWNMMSQRLPHSLGGQLIVFESIFAVIYAHWYRLEWPSLTLTIGYTLLLSGVLLSLMVFRHVKAH